MLRLPSLFGLFSHARCVRINHDACVLPTKSTSFTPEMGPLYEATQRDAWVFTPLKVANRLLGALAVSWVAEREFSHDELTVIDAFGAQCAQALDRIRIADAQRESALQLQRLGEALQRNLLTQPPKPTDLDIAFRYLPAVNEAQVGGDWYDAFDSASGATIISVGDVAGHDLKAAAAMAQLRNLLRGLAVTGPPPLASLTESVTLAWDPTSPGQARELTARMCAAAGFTTELCATCVLLTSELVTNAVLHGRSQVRLTVTGPGGVRVEVGEDSAACRSSTTTTISTPSTGAASS